MVYYRPTGNEIAIFETAAANHLPVLLKGPTGCGKTRFVRYMAERLGRDLVTVEVAAQKQVSVVRHAGAQGVTVFEQGGAVDELPKRIGRCIDGVAHHCQVWGGDHVGIIGGRRFRFPIFEL